MAGLGTLARRLLLVLLLLTLFARPHLGSGPAPTSRVDLEVLIVLDRTTSMAAEDHDGGRPRLDGARRDALTLASALPGARVSLLTFGLDDRVDLPFSTDTAALGTALSFVRAEGSLVGGGSRVDRPLRTMDEVLSRASRDRPDRRRVVVYLGDGENTQGGRERSFAGLRPLVDDGAVLGYGTRRGGVMREDAPADPTDPPAAGRGRLVLDVATGQPARSRIDEGALVRAADELGVPYLRRDTSDEAPLRALARSFSAPVEQDRDGAAVPSDRDLTWLVALLLLGPALLELRLGWRRLLGARRDGAGR